jgi:endonuclease YncB( thermonuclease family)
VAEAPATKPAAPANDDALLSQGQFVVAAVLTGDRFVILDPGGRERRIRIFGTSSPKLDQPLGIESKENLSRLVLGKNVTISVRRSGPDGDVVADVVISGTNIGLEQLRAGMVRLVEDEVSELNAEQQRVYAEADNVAKNGAFGLWAGSNGTAAPNQPVASFSSQVPSYRSTGPSAATPGPSENISTPDENSAVVAPKVEAPTTMAVSQPKETQPAPTPGVNVRPANTVKSVDAKPAVPAPPVRQGPKIYTRGPRGGCFFISASGNKTYVDRSLCN